MNLKNEFWYDSLGRHHARLFEDVNEDGTLTIFHIPSTHCTECRKEIKPYKDDYSGYDLMTCSFLHFSRENNFCKDCSLRISSKLNLRAKKANAFALETTYGALTQSGYHEITYVQSKGGEVSPEYDPDCEKIETMPEAVADIKTK